MILLGGRAPPLSISKHGFVNLRLESQCTADSQSPSKIGCFDCDVREERHQFAAFRHKHASRPIGMLQAIIRISDDTINSAPATIHKDPRFQLVAIAISCCLSERRRSSSRRLRTFIQIADREATSVVRFVRNSLLPVFVSSRDHDPARRPDPEARPMLTKTSLGY